MSGPDAWEAVRQMVGVNTFPCAPALRMAGLGDTAHVSDASDTVRHQARATALHDI